jgi:hypothetical protein
LAAFPGPDDFPDDDDEQMPDYSVLFDAPDYTSLIQHKTSAKAQDTSKKIQSLMKSGFKASFNAGRVPDAATFLKYGKDFGDAVGDLTDVSPTADKIVTMLTAPDSPAFTFALVTAGMLFQFVRNHEPEVEKAKKTWRERRQEKKQAKLNGTYVKPEPTGKAFKVRMLGRTFNVRIHMRIPVVAPIFKGLTAQTQAPNALVWEVFGNDKMRAAMKKQGYAMRTQNPDDNE